MNNVDFIIKLLIKRGHDTAFGVTGGGAMFLNEAFRKAKKLNFIFTHHEQSAAMAAEAYYRIKKKASILSITSGPGGTNAVTGVIGAWIDSIPMIVISGQVESKDLIGKSKTRQIGIQEANIIDVAKPIVKYSKTLTKSSDIELELNKAIDIAYSGRPGPVWLDIPLDVQSQKFNSSKKSVKYLSDNNKKNINKNIKIEEIYKLIEKSKRPIFLIGNGVHISKSETLFLKIIQKLKLPILSTWNASDIIPSSKNFYFGRPGLFGNRIANFAIQSCDLLIILGSRLSVPITGYQIKNFSPNSKKIYIDIDKFEIKKRGLKTDVPINADLNFFLEKLKTYLKKKNKIEKVTWIKELTKLKNSLDEDKNYKNHNKYINSFNFINHLSRKLDGKKNIVTDMGTSFTCTMQSFKTKKNQRLFTSSGIAAMGFGLPGLIGAYFADKNKTPICITGDGGIMFNLQELQTIKNYKIPAKIFIINNGGYLTMKLMQKKNFKKFVGSDEKSGVKLPNFSKLSKSFDYEFFTIDSEKRIDNILSNILKSNKAVICEVMMPPMQELIPRVQTQMNKDGTFEPAMLDNMYPFISKDRIKVIRQRLLSID
jgi:acetolactate synthase-1/2/3 large subunit